MQNRDVCRPQNIDAWHCGNMFCIDVAALHACKVAWHCGNMFAAMFCVMLPLPQAMVTDTVGLCLQRCNIGQTVVLHAASNDAMVLQSCLFAHPVVNAAWRAGDVA